MRLAARVAVAVVCLAALLGLCVHYGATYDENWPHPTGDQLRGDYDAYAGERVLLFGEIQSVDRESGTAVIHVTDSADAVAAELEIRGIDAVANDIGPGGTLQVYGVLEADRTMTPEETVVVNRDSSAVRYKLATSVVGGLFAVGYFLRHWRLKLGRETIGFEPRSDAPTRSRRPSDDPGPTTDESTEGTRNG